ncbi:hypothetical protein E2C01_055562 [Portunus trituberculatus]|uniref:Uncharacterized protein n=1 Tax=Portunus trituberculatus TaxID=210409 RepID=A0A5B7GMT3_PORTR|nr:hypothetical protein [Portunus trituberculatus]
MKLNKIKQRSQKTRPRPPSLHNPHTSAVLPHLPYTTKPPIHVAFLTSSLHSSSFNYLLNLKAAMAPSAPPPPPPAMCPFSGDFVLVLVID